jgi:formylmethanofuran--tetrahydromethanopterin N-formyltransferase
MAATAENLLTLNGVAVADTFAEAFPIRAARLIITADSLRWATTAATVLCGNATSVIACDAEAAIEQKLEPEHTPDARPGVSVLIFGFSVSALAAAVQNRVGQCVLTCPTTACFSGLPADACPKDRRIRVGGVLRFFGDGWQSSRRIESTRYWRIPVMDGEFLCEDEFATVSAVAGGNLLICGTDSRSTLAAAELAAEAAQSRPGVALPFPGGIVRSGSKVGSRYPKLRQHQRSVVPHASSTHTLEHPGRLQRRLRNCHRWTLFRRRSASHAAGPARRHCGPRNPARLRWQLWRKTRQASLPPARFAVTSLGKVWLVGAVPEIPA